MKLLHFTIIKLTIFLIIGILLSHYFSISLYQSAILTILLCIGLAIIYFISKPLFTKNVWFGIMAFLTMISIGILVVNIHDHRNFKNHYSHSNNFENGNPSFITLKITDRLKSNNYNDRYVADILKIDGLESVGLAILNINNDSISKPINVDNVLIIESKLYPLTDPLNPSQFNYKAFLENKNIYSQLYTNYQSLYIVSQEKSSVFGLADAFRAAINKRLKQYNFGANELSIINALILGQRKEISNEIYDDYKKAGAIHILAVSGLHVGIILLFLNFFFKPIEFFKNGHIYKITLIILCLWSFAIVAGLSASVTRAATMFSLVAIGMNLKRPVNTLNILAISAFILLLIKPSFLYDVGFQLSYMAVIGIVTFYPYFYRLFKPKYWVFDKIWQAFVVSIAAQFGILPISFFYFHQFPGLFLLSNVVIIPILGIILGYGITLIGLALLGLLPNFVATFYGNIISWMNNFFKWISQQEVFYFKDITFNLLEVITSYFIVLAIYQFYKAKSFKNISYILATIILFQGVQIYLKQKHKTANEFIIFHKSRQTLIGLHQGETLKFHHNLTDFNKSQNQLISNFTTDNNISTIKEDSIQSIYTFNNEKILVIDSLGIYNVSSFKPEYILLRNSPRVNLDRVLDSLNPKLIIADGSNYKSYLRRWKSTCEKQKTPFHQTSEKGAFILK